MEQKPRENETRQVDFCLNNKIQVVLNRKKSGQKRDSNCNFVYLRKYNLRKYEKIDIRIVLVTNFAALWDVTAFCTLNTKTYVSEEYIASSSDASAASTRINDLILLKQQNNLQIQHRSISMVLLVTEWVGFKMFPGNLCRVYLR